MILHKDILADFILAITIITVSIIPMLNAGYDNRASYFMLLTLCILAICTSIKYKKNKLLNLGKPFLWLMLFIIWSLLSLIWSVSKLRTIIELIQIISCGFIFHFISTMNEEDKLRVGRIAVITGVLIAVLGIIEYIFVNTSIVVSTFPHHNPFGIYIAMIFLTMWGYNLRESKTIYWIISIILFITLLLSASRGAIIAMVVSLPLVFINIEKRYIFKSILKTFCCITIAVIFTLIIMKIAPYIQDKNAGVKELTQALVRTNDFMPSAVGGRLEFWKIAVKLWFNKPISGYGLGTYYTAYYVEATSSVWYSRFAHNEYLQIAAELGTVGLIIFSGFLFVSFKSIFKRIKNRDASSYLLGATAACSAFLMHIFIDFSWNYPGALYIFFALLAAVVGDSKSKEARLSFKINHKFKIMCFAIIALITVWQLSSELVFAKAYQLSLSDNLQASNNMFDIGRKLYPMNPSSYYFEGNNYYRLYKQTKDEEQFKRSEDLIKKATKLSPYEWVYFNTLGEMYLETGNEDKAEQYFSQAVRYSSYRVQPYFNLGNLYYKQNRIEEAKKTFEKGLTSQSAFWGISDKVEQEELAGMMSLMHYYLANIYNNEGNKSAAEEHIANTNKFIKDYPGIIKYYIKSSTNN